MPTNTYKLYNYTSYTIIVFSMFKEIKNILESMSEEQKTIKNDQASWEKKK